MKALQIPLLAAGTVILASGFFSPKALAQEQDPSVVLQKQVSYEQTSATTVIPSSTTPYSFSVDVSTPSTTPAPTVTGPGGGTENLVYSAQDEQWESPESAAASAALLDAADPNGVYAVDVNGVTTDLDLTGDAYSNTPILTLGGGHWSTAAGGEYVIAANQTLTINSNVFTDSGSIIDSVGLLEGPVDFPGQFGALGSSLSYSVAPNSLPAGSVVDLSVSFAAVTDEQTDGDGNLAAVAGYVEKTDIMIKVVGATVPDAGSTCQALAIGVSLLALLKKRPIRSDSRNFAAS